jgi:Uma2 family endonuclease
VILLLARYNARVCQEVSLIMSTAVVRTLPPGQWLRLSNVDWTTYTRLLRAFAESPGVRLTYDRGELEIMAPLFRHDYDSRFLGRIVQLVTMELGLPLIDGGSVTVRRRAKNRGIEADDCFWIANAHRMRGRRRLGLRRDPPPDLAIEVDVTNSSLDRLTIYAALRVPEIWRLTNRDVLTFHALDANGEYQVAQTSLAIPVLTPAKVLEVLQLARKTGDQNRVARRVMQWARKNKGKEDSSQ